MKKNKIESFQYIHNTFRPKIHRYLTRFVGKNEAEDLTQEVFIKVDQGLKNFRGESQLSTWIYRIATNVAIDKLRTRSFQQLSQEKSLDGIGIENEILTEEKPLSIKQEFIKKEMNKCIRNFIEKLPENYQAIFVLKKLEELKNDEIAKILGLSINVIKIRLHRAKVMLKKELETHCSFYRDERNELACDPKSVLK